MDGRPIIRNPEADIAATKKFLASMNSKELARWLKKQGEFDVLIMLNNDEAAALAPYPDPYQEAKETEHEVAAAINALNQKAFNLLTLTFPFLIALISALLSQWTVIDTAVRLAGLVMSGGLFLSAADVFSGWTEPRAPRNRPRRRVNDAVVDIRGHLRARC